MIRFGCAAVAGAFVLAGAIPASAQNVQRWIDVQAVSLAARYRLVEDSRGVRTTNQVQESTALKARVKADRSGRLSLNIGAFTGTSFTGGWNNTGLGTGEGSVRHAVKQLYVSYSPRKGVEGQVGSLYFVRGEATEITTYDNDGYVAGERVTLKRPRQLFFDEISATHGYLGDLNTPSVFGRTNRLARSNYRQVLVGKHIGPAATASVDWTDAASRTAWRAAVALRPTRIVNGIRVEYYVRPTEQRHGGAIVIDRTLTRRVTASGGYANIDREFGQVNGDRYFTGARVFGSVTTPVVGPLSATVFYTHTAGNAFPVPIGQRVDLLLSCNVLAAVRSRAHP